MTMKLLIFSLFTFVISSEALAYSCTISQIKANNPKFCDELRESTPLTDSSMRELFNEIQGYMKEFILKGRTVDQLSMEEKSVYARISTVQFSSFRNCGNDREGRPVVDASYDTTAHSVKFCDGLKNFPISALVGMIGHEIGHSGDSCSVQCYHVHAPNRSRLTLPNNYLRSSEADAAFQAELRSSNQAISLTARALMSRPEIVQRWRDVPGVIINEPMPLNNYPLNAIRRCLIDQDKIWEAPATEPTDQIARDRNTGPGCKSHTDSESMADVWGAFALGKYFDKHPEKRGAAALGMFESRKKELCSPKGYPSTVARLESIWMAAPGVAQALGCEAVPERMCMSQQPFPASLARRPGSNALVVSPANTPANTDRSSTPTRGTENRKSDTGR